ncbi:MAG: glycosyltransferase [Burkholderiales bacterium]|nr:glycosyltransferase [Burkholderiales bacterium]
MPIIDIVVPVRGALHALRKCIDSVHASRNIVDYELVVVDDGNTEPELVRYLAYLRDERRATVVTQPSRQGYTASVNRAVALHRERDVVVLHSDAEVANDWLDRLRAHASAADVGLIGCFTNTAGVATYPLPRRANPLPSGETVASLDARFARANRAHAVALPAVSGPCLYFRRACLEAIGVLDAAPIGSDYGVEVDFCLRAASAGFRHLLAGDVFVGHAGHGSCASWDEGELLAARAQQALMKLYPMYRAQVQEVDAGDPARPFARRVDLARLAQSPRYPIVFISHPWGGGIRRYMHDLVALTEDRCDVLFLEPAVGDTVKLSWPKAGEGFALYFTLPHEFETLVATLHAIGVARLHFHHIHLQPQAILDLPDRLGVPYDYTLHDYHPICPQYHLVTEDGRYCGEPDIAGCTACLAGRPALWGLDIVTWRARFARLLRGAERVIAPSNDVVVRMHRYLPDREIVVWPHPESPIEPVPRIVRVAILGNLSPEKGLHVVAACARDAVARSLPLTFRVLGSTTEPIPQAPDAPLTIYGQYAEGDLSRLIAAERPDVLLFAAQVPETYAYTMSVALASGLPIVASALGALPERLAGVPRSTTVPWDAPAMRWNDALLGAGGVEARPAATASARASAAVQA